MKPPFPACPLFVLLVEDHGGTAHSLALLLRFYGHEVFVAHDEKEARYFLDLMPPDVILMDIGLPGDDGYRVAGRLLAQLPHKPLLLAMTGYGHLEERSKRAGFHYHFEKPFEPEPLVDLLHIYAEKLVASW